MSQPGKQTDNTGRYDMLRLDEGVMAWGIATGKCVESSIDPVDFLLLDHPLYRIGIYALRPFFRHDRRLFSDVSRLIYDIVRDLYDEGAAWAKSPRLLANVSDIDDLFLLNRTVQFCAIA